MLTHEKIIEIEKNITKDIEQEFKLIQKELNFFLTYNFDLYFLREFIKHYPPKAVRDRAEVLLETLLNYFMKDLIEDIKKLDHEKQYQFFKEGLREKIKERALNNLNKLIPSSVKIPEEKDFEKKYPVVGTVILTSGGIATAIILPESLIIKSIPAASSILASIYLLKSYKDQSKRLKRKWKKRVDDFLGESKDIITSWLKDVEKELIFEINRVYSTLFTSDIKIEQSLLNLGSSSNKT
ncbi:MAG: hypothetical protein ACP5HI_05200 [Caldimicrobium sp.]|jgi:hypothetical protein